MNEAKSGVSDSSLARAWAVPLLLVGLSIAGLVLALVYEGAIDIVAVTLVIVPLVVVVHLLARRTTSPATRIP